MTIEQIQLQVEQYLGSAQINEAIDLLLQETKQKGLQKAKQNALLLRSQFFSLKQKYEIRGMLHHQEYQVEANRIAAGVLALAQEGLVEEEHGSPRRWYLIRVAAVGILLLAVAWYWLLPEKPLATQTQTNTTGQANPTTVHVVPSDTTQQKVKEKPIEKTNQDGNGTTSNRHNVIQPVTPETISIEIAIDDYWNGAEILVDGKEKGTLNTYSKTIKVKKKNSDYKIVLRKTNGEVSQPQYYSLEDDRLVNFTHQ